VILYPGAPVADYEDKGLRDRISEGSEEAIGNLAQTLLENPVFNSALATALGAGEKAVQAQRSAMGALNLPAATDVDRLERRVRSVSERVEAIEDRIDEIARDLSQIRRQQAELAEVAKDQSRLDVEESQAS
jgi:TolA-binding protein